MAKAHTSYKIFTAVPGAERSYVKSWPHLVFCGDAARAATFRGADLKRVIREIGEHLERANGRVIPLRARPASGGQESGIRYPEAPAIPLRARPASGGQDPEAPAIPLRAARPASGGQDPAKSPA